MATFDSIEFGDYLNVTDLGGGTIRVDGCPPGGGAGLQFHSGTYGADNVGDYSAIESVGSSPGIFTQPFNQGTGVGGDAGYSIAFNSADGAYFTSDGAIPLTVELITTGSSLNNALYVNSVGAYAGGTGQSLAIDASAGTNGSGKSTAVSADATNGSNTSGDAYGVVAVADTHYGTSTGVAYGLNATATAKGGDAIAVRANATISGGGAGTAYAFKAVAGLVDLNLPTSPGPTGTLYSNLGIVTVSP